MEDMTHSYDTNESEQTVSSGNRALVISLTEEVELDRVDYETLLDEIRI